MANRMGGRLGAYLLQRQLVTEAQIEKALDRQRARNVPLTQLLIELGYITSEQLTRVFPQLSLVEVLKDRELGHFADSFIYRRLAHGDVVFRQGDAGHEAYVVVKGQIRIVREYGSRQEDLAMLEAGELFGEIALLDGDPRTATAIAASEVTELMVLPRSAFLEQVRLNANLAADMFRMFARRFRSLESLLDARQSVQA